MNKPISMFVYAFFLFLLSPMAWAQILYVQSLEAKLLSEPKVNATELAKLERGTRVELIADNASWYQVRHENSEGWIFRYFVAEHPPLESAGPALSDELDREHVRRRASAVATAGATRGLGPEERNRAHEMGIADYHALNKMDALIIDGARLNHFVKTGIPE
ncbi:MAG: SH3 domain-containing protein [Thiohalomonadaceae bacterium]